MKRNREILYLTTKVGQKHNFYAPPCICSPDTFLYNDEETKIFHWIVNFVYSKTWFIFTFMQNRPNSLNSQHVPP